jgi:GMP synthase-like glutamine amidotransferase
MYKDKDLPKLEGYSCVILPGAFYSDVVKMFKASGFTIGTDHTLVDLVVFTGGSDVDPSLYDEEAIKESYTNPRRDEYEKKIYDECLAAKVPMFGICRGHQFLHVMNGGKLYQDVTGHAGGIHDIIDLDNNETIPNASSIHHQMCKYDPEIGMKLIAVSSWSRSRHFKDATSVLTPATGKTVDWETELGVIRVPGSVLEVEAAFYPDTMCIGVQGHPEICEGKEYQAWSMELVKDFLLGDFEGVPKFSPKLIPEKG